MVGGWNAELDLAVAHRDGYSWLRRREHVGPLTLQRPFYPEGQQTPHVYLLHPPGGVVAGDTLTIRCDVDASASVLVTTPGAAKFYRARAEAPTANPISNNFAEQVQELSAGAGASLEWMPQEGIAFSGAQVRLTTRVALAPDANFAAWDIICLGRPGCAEVFESGCVRQKFEISRHGCPLFRERNIFQSAAPVMTASWGLHRHPVSGLFVYASADFDLADDSRSGGAQSDLVNQIREVMRGVLGEQTTVSLLRGVLVCRYLGGSTERAKQLFGAAWAVLRPAVLGKAACPPRIWAT